MYLYDFVQTFVLKLNLRSVSDKFERKRSTISYKRMNKTTQNYVREYLLLMFAPKKYKYSYWVRNWFGKHVCFWCCFFEKSSFMKSLLT